MLNYQPPILFSNYRIHVNIEKITLTCVITATFHIEKLSNYHIFTVVIALMISL